MGQKVHPVGIRLGIVKEHNSVWYANSSQYSKLLLNDLEVRQYIFDRLKNASVSRVKIERPSENARITIFTARPGVVIGKKGEDIERLRHEVANLMGVPVQINIEEIRKPDTDAKLVAENIARQLERRVMFRRAMKRAVQNALKAGAKGIKVRVAGRLGGAEIARAEWYREGRVPLHTFRADIDYSEARGETSYGTIGVKVWIFKGEILGGVSAEQSATEDNPKKRARKKPAGRRPAAKKALAKKTAATKAVQKKTEDADKGE